MTTPAPDKRLTLQARTNVQQRAATLTQRIADIHDGGAYGTIGVLLAGAIAPLVVSPAAAANPLTVWLASLGSNVLAGWIAIWIQHHWSHISPTTTIDMEPVITSLAADWSRAAATDPALAADGAHIIQATNVVPVLDSALPDDVQRGTMYRALEHDLTQLAHPSARLVELLEEVRLRLEDLPPPATTPTSQVNFYGSANVTGPVIGGNVGTITTHNITAGAGGIAGYHIGSATTHNDGQPQTTHPDTVVDKPRGLEE